MVPIILFILDFLIYAIFDYWLVYSLAIYFIFLSVYREKIDRSFYVSAFLILVQNCFLYQRFGLGLLFLIPIFSTARFLKSVFLKNWLLILNYFLVILFFVLEFVVIKKLIFLQNLALKSTFLIFLVNIMISSLILFGTRGNRFLSLL